ncbi:hypothetical protein HK104_001539, partial [Borealophlyctis nickersoniae]
MDSSKGPYELIYKTFSGRPSRKRPQISLPIPQHDILQGRDDARDTPAALPPVNPQQSSRPSSKPRIRETLDANGAAAVLGLLRHEGRIGSASSSSSSRSSSLNGRPTRKSQSLERPSAGILVKDAPSSSSAVSRGVQRSSTTFASSSPPAAPVIPFSARFGVAAVPRPRSQHHPQHHTHHPPHHAQSVAVRKPVGLRHRPSLPSLASARDIEEQRAASQKRREAAAKPANPALSFANLHKLAEVESRVLGKALVDRRRVFVREDVIDEIVEGGRKEPRK